MRFTKIKIGKGDKVEINWQEKSKNGGDWESHSLTSSDEPKPEFKAAMDDLIPDFVSQTELPSGDKASCQVYAVLFHYETDIGDAFYQLSGLKKMKNSIGAYSLTGPNKWQKKGKAESEERHFTEYH